MDLIDKIDELNQNIDNEDTKKEAIILKHKLTRLAYIWLITSSIILVLSFAAFIILVLLGLTNYNSIILFSIIPFIFMVLSVFGIFFGVSYKRLKNEINL